VGRPCSRIAGVLGGRSSDRDRQHLEKGREGITPDLAHVRTSTILGKRLPYRRSGPTSAGQKFTKSQLPVTCSRSSLPFPLPGWNLLAFLFLSSLSSFPSSYSLSPPPPVSFLSFSLPLPSFCFSLGLSSSPLLPSVVSSPPASFLSLSSSSLLASIFAPSPRLSFSLLSPPALLLFFGFRGYCLLGAAMTVDLLGRPLRVDHVSSHTPDQTPRVGLRDKAVSQHI